MNNLFAVLQETESLGFYEAGNRQGSATFSWTGVFEAVRKTGSTNLRNRPILALLLAKTIFIERVFGNPAGKPFRFLIMYERFHV